MKNVGANLKLFVCVTFILACLLFSAFNLTPLLTINLHADNSLSLKSTIYDESGFENFSNVVLSLTQQYPVDDNAVVFFNKKNDLILGDNGEYLVTGKTFTELTEIIVDSSGTFVLYRLVELAEQNGYDLTEGDNNMVLTRQFGTKRLLIYTDDNNIDLRGAVVSASYNDMHIHQYETEAMARAAYEYYLTCQDVKSVCVDSICWVEDDGASTEGDGVMISIDPNEELSYLTWGATKMDVQKYSQYLLDTVKAENNDISALPEVTVVVLDTGIDTDHPWFQNRMLRDENGKFIGYDYTGVASTTEYAFEDDQGHGTHCAGIICDMTLPNVKILPIKFMKKGSDGNSTGDTTHAVLAVLRVALMAKQYNIVAINMSFGAKSTGTSGYLSNIQAAINSDVFCIAAAGNETDDAANYSPANISGVITVSALDATMSLASYSNYGDCVDVCAPGSSIRSAFYIGEYTYLSGTSMATPHVVAFVALLKSDLLHSYTTAEINQIFTGEKPEFIQDLGPVGKDTSFGYGMPVLAAGVPDYVTVEANVIGGYGTSSISGFNMFDKGSDVVVTFAPDAHYHVKAVYVDNELLPNSIEMNQYTFENISESHTIAVEFEVDPITYTVNHYLEKCYDVNSDVTHEYELTNTEQFTTSDAETSARAHVYIGFSAKTFEQQPLIHGEDTVINIYYSRNFYNVSVEKSGDGIAKINGVGKYLFGSQVGLTPEFTEGYELNAWSLSECDDLDFSIKNYNLMQKFEMPASDVKLILYAKPVIHLVTVKVVGKGRMITPDNVIVQHGAEKIYEFKAEDGYKLKSVMFDGVEQEVVAGPNGVYRVSLASVTDDTEISVVFEENESSADMTKMAIEIGGGIAATILFGSSIIMLTLAFRRRKRF